MNRTRATRVTHLIVLNFTQKLKVTIPNDNTDGYIDEMSSIKTYCKM
jgi:hypothetical protein